MSITKPGHKNMLTCTYLAFWVCKNPHRFILWNISICTALHLTGPGFWIKFLIPRVLKAIWSFRPIDRLSFSCLKRGRFNNAFTLFKLCTFTAPNIDFTSEKGSFDTCKKPVKFAIYSRLAQKLRKVIRFSPTHLSLYLFPISFNSANPNFLIRRSSCYNSVSLVRNSISILPLSLFLIHFYYRKVFKWHFTNLSKFWAWLVSDLEKVIDLSLGSNKFPISSLDLSVCAIVTIKSHTGQLLIITEIWYDDAACCHKESFK